jgi:hypothetical protein
MPSRIIQGYKLQFYSADRTEPPHLHIVKAEKRAKIWLADLSIAWNRNFNPKELQQILDILEKNQQQLTDWYHDFFS